MTNLAYYNERKCERYTVYLDICQSFLLLSWYFLLLELLLHQLIFSVQSTLWKTKVDRFLFQIFILLLLLHLTGRNRVFCPVFFMQTYFTSLRRNCTDPEFEDGLNYYEERKIQVWTGLQIFFYLSKSSSFSMLKVHKNENFFGFDFEVCTFS